jgi:hypothetical protein
VEMKDRDQGKLNFFLKTLIRMMVKRTDNKNFSPRNEKRYNSFIFDAWSSYYCTGREEEEEEEEEEEKHNRVYFH